MRQAEVFFVDVRNRPADGANQVVMRPAVNLNAERTVVQADFAEHAALDEQMNILVYSSE